MNDLVKTLCVVVASVVFSSMSAVGQEPVVPYSDWQAKVTVYCGREKVAEYSATKPSCDEAKACAMTQATAHECPPFVRKRYDIPFTCQRVQSFLQNQNASDCYPWVVTMRVCLCDGSGAELNIEAAGHSWCAAVNEAKRIAKMLIGECFCGCHYTYCFTIDRQPCVGPQKPCRPRMLFKRRCR